MKRKLLSILTLLVLTVVNAQAATYYVATTGDDDNPGTQAQPFETLEKGINVAQTGDTVLVANGHYYGSFNTGLNFGGKNIILKSQGGAANCIIDCAIFGRGFDFASGENAQAVLEGFTIRNARSEDLGGAISIRNSSPTIRGCVLHNNTAFDSTARGGAIYIENGSPTLINCTFMANSANRGGGLYCDLSAPTLINCTFTRNISTFLGGGMFNNYSNATLTNCVFNGNSADYGGGVYNEYSASIVTNSSFSGNTTLSGGGMFNGSSNATLTNCTFSGNSAEYGGGGMDNVACTPTVTNCILWGEQWPAISRDQPILSYSDVQGLSSTPDANHNFGADPRFVRNPSPGPDNQWGTEDDDYGDLRLQANSPCINAGNAAAAGLPPYDKGYKNRIAGSAPDQGAYEFGSSPYSVAHFYVDKVGGNDVTGNGTSAAPFQTVNKALSQVSAPLGFTTIHVKAGNYGNDRPQVTQQVRFVNWGNTGQARIGKP
jgi:hypothetical protein